MTDEQMVAKAIEARLRAYAPYSGFQVGAALLTEDGRVFSGGNVENISFGLTMCAERVAIGSAVQAGATKFTLLALVSDSQEPVAPCGACRQVLAEFNPKLPIVSTTLAGRVQHFALAELLPMSRQGILG